MWSNSSVNKGFYAAFCAALLIVFLSGCASFSVYNPATGRNEFVAIPTSEEIKMGQAVHQNLDNQYKVSSDPKYVGRLARVGQKVAMVSDRQDYPYNFYVIEGDDINAFTTPGGNIYVYTGLLDKMPTDDQVAFVLAHEIGHCAARHVIKKYQAALGYDIIEDLIFSQLGDGKTSYRTARLGTNALMSLVFSSYSRKDEFEADRLGVKYVYLAGYDPNGAAESLEIIRKESEGKGGMPLILRSHPHLKDRIEQVQSEIAYADKQYKSVSGHIYP